MTPPPPRRRWFQFSLRTMFVVVTALVFAIWLGSEWKVVRDRAVILAANGTRWSVTETEAQYYGPNNVYVKYFHLPGPVSVPFVRRCLGDEAVVLISAPPGGWKADIETVRRLFPEAVVLAEPYEYLQTVKAEEFVIHRKDEKMGRAPRKILRQ